MKNFVRGLFQYLPDLAILAGAAAVTAGCALIYLPLGLIVGGGLVMAGGILSILGSGDGP